MDDEMQYQHDPLYEENNLSEPYTFHFLWNLPLHFMSLADKTLGEGTYPTMNHVHELASSGHNLLVTGQAGSGKTTTVIAMMNILSRMGRSIAVTASTGIAAKLLTHQKAMTLHKWCGLKVIISAPV